MASTETAQRRYRRPPRSSSSSAGLAPQAVPKSAPSTLKEHAVDDRLHVESNFGITNDAMLQKFEGENLIPHILQSVQTQPLLSDVLTPSTMASPPHGHANLPSSKVHSLSPVVCSDSRLTGPPMSLPAATLTVPKRNILRHLGVIPSTSTSRRPSALLSKASVPTNSQEAAGRTGSEDATRRHLPPLHSGLTDKRVTPARIDISVGALSLGNPVETPSPPLSDDLTTESGSTAQTSPVLSFSRTTSNSSVQSQSKDVSIAQKIEQLAREVDVLRRREQRHPSRNLSCTPVPATGSHHGNVHSGSSAVSSSSGVSSASCQAQRNQELGTRDIQPSSSAHRKAPSQVQHDTASSSEVSQPTAALKPDDFVDQSIPNRNIRARFCSGLEVQLITTPFEPAYLTVTGIPIDLVMTSGNNINQTVKTQERDELRFHSKRRGLGEARPTPQPYQQPGIQVDYVARTKRMMREIFESFGIVTNLEFRYVGESRRSSDDNISSIGKAPRADGAPKPLLREAGGANARYSGRQSVFTVVPPLLMPSNASNASGERVNGRDEASEMRTHTRTNGNVRQGKAQTHDAVGPSRSVGVGNSVKMVNEDRRTVTRLTQRSSTATGSARPTNLPHSVEGTDEQYIIANGTREEKVSSVRSSEVNIVSCTVATEIDPTTPKKVDANCKAELVANVQYAHHAEALCALRTLNAGGRLTLPERAVDATLRSIVLPSTFSATFSTPLVPDQPSSNMVSDTVRIKWNIPVPKLRLYYRDPRVARREVEIINNRTFFGRRLFARFLGRSKNIVLVEGVRHCHVLKGTKRSQTDEQGTLSDPGSHDERRIFEEELKELEKRHQPDGEVTLFDDHYDHGQAMEFIRQLFREEQERARAEEEQSRALAGSASNVGGPTHKCGLRYHDIRETLPCTTIQSREPSAASTPEAPLEVRGGSVVIIAYFHSSVAASNFYTQFQRAVADLPWRSSTKLFSVLSQDLLYVMTFERLAILAPQIDELRTRLAAAHLRLQITIPQGQQAYRYVRISGVANLRPFKPMIDAILVGEIIMLPGANSAQSQPLWDDELDFLYNLDKIVDTALLPPQTQVLVESSRKRLRVFGPSAARRKTAIERIVKRLGEVKRRLMTIEFDRSLLKYYAHAADNQLAPAFGQSNVWLDAAACKISVAGTGAVIALKEVQKRAPRPNALLDLFLRGDDGARNEAEETIRCPVCLERAMCPVEGLGCEHTYCESCLKRYLVCTTQPGSGVSFPLRCFGAVVVEPEKSRIEVPQHPQVMPQGKRKGRHGRRQPGVRNEVAPVSTAPTQDTQSLKKSCDKSIPLEVVRRLLTPEQFEMAMNRSFESYTNSRPDEFRHCPTSDCPEIFRILADPAKAPAANAVHPNSAWTSTLAQHCPSCLVKLCPICFAQGGHDGQSCAQYKKQQQRVLEEEAQQAEKLVQSFGGRTCPKCRMGLLKDGGCAHIRCSRCGVHICWTCGKTFEEVDKESVYEHMTRVHGSIGLINWGEAEDDDGWQLAIMMNDAHDQNGIGRRDLRHAHGVEVGWGGGEQVEELPNPLTLSGSGSSAGRPIVSTSRRKNGQQASANQDQASSSNKARSRRRKGKQGPNYQARPHRNHYNDKEEFSEDENDDFGVADWDYDYADVNWEAF